MTAHAPNPSSLSPASCPLLSAVLPLRYAIGPTRAVDTGAYDLPPLDGSFPGLGDRYRSLEGRSLSYTARLLRDGWLYVWQRGLQRLVEYRVENALLGQTSRAGRVIDGRSLPYLLLPAGEPAMLAWSPVQWSDPQYLAAKAKPGVRKRVMREITPGAAPFGGPAHTIHESIGDYMDAPWYGWSCAETAHRPAWPQLLEDMRRCDQQAYALIDDPWGVLLDLANLIRVRQQVFDVTRQIRGEDWAMAGVLQSLANSDRQIASQLRSMTDHQKLRATWQEQSREEERHSAEIRRITGFWGAWFNTLTKTGPATLETASGHFDITKPTARTELELHFAAVCLGPSYTSLGAKAIAKALMPQDEVSKPWLLLALLGLGKRLSVAEINSLTGLIDGLRDNGASLMNEARQLATSINEAADKLAKQRIVPTLEALFTALAPVAGLGLQHANAGTRVAGQLYLAAALARSQQRLAVETVSTRQLGEWMSDLIGTRPQLPARFTTTPLSSAVQNALPFLHLIPAKNLPPLTGQLAAEVSLKDMTSLSKGALEKTPIKCLVALVAGANLAWSGAQLFQAQSVKGWLSFGGGVTGVSSAMSAIWQKVAEIDWKATAKISGEISASTQKALADALSLGANTALLQAVTSGLDVLVYGIETFDAYKTGDLDTAAINAGLTVASAANLTLYVQTFRSVRAARAAVIAGEATALGRGVSTAPHLAARALGVTILIVGGVIARLYTQDTPLEKWVKQTRFGTRPADWADSYEQSMTELYKILFPIVFEAYRLNELNPRKGMQPITYLMLHLPGKEVLTDDMVHFKGEEVWGGFLGHGGSRKPVEWTGKDFDRHGGTRANRPPNEAVYRRVYHDENGMQLNSIRGQLTYSPLEGLTLPAIEIKELAWL